MGDIYAHGSAEPVTLRGCKMSDAEKLKDALDMYGEYKDAKFKHVTDTPADSLLVRLESDSGERPLVIVDVRSAEEIAVSSIKDSLSEAEFDQWIQDRRRRMHESGEVPEETDIIAYCTIGYRSGLFCKKWQDRLGKEEYKSLNLREISNLEGGIVVLSHHYQSSDNSPGVLQFRDEEEPAIHCYNIAKWGKVPSAYQAVDFHSEGSAWMPSLLRTSTMAVAGLAILMGLYRLRRR